MHTDHFMEIGSSHKVCEDYIISGMDPVPHVILSDGCSSSENTDVGARILCYTARRYLNTLNQNSMNWADSGTWIIKEANRMRSYLGLNKSALDATLMMIWVPNIETKHIQMFIYGDGNTMVLFEKLDKIHHYEHNFKCNAPYYLSYQLIPDGRERYTNKFGFSENYYEDWYAKEHHEWELYHKERTFLPANFPTAYLQPPKAVSAVIIASDGLSSFMLDEYPYSDIDIHDIIDNLTDFKSTKDSFIQRRTRRTTKMLRNAGVVHTDDLSIGGIWLND